MDTEIMGSETVYGNDISDEDAHVMSDRVQSVATNIYREFERMIPSYGEDVVKEMMPHIVTILENLDQAYKENQEKDAELELCKDDNEQLMTQYEREKQLRKSTDQKLMAIEDQMEEERKETNGEIESLKLTVRTYELKAKNSQDHILRLEDKEAEWKREYGKVHEQYTELLKKHMEHVEKSKLLMGAERMFDMGAAPRKNFQMPNLRHIAAGGGIHSPDVTRSGYETSQFALVSPVVTKNMSVSLDNELSDYGRVHQNVETETAEKDMNTETVQVYERGTGTSSILSPTSDEFADNSRNKYDKPPKTNDQELSSIYDELVEVDDDDGFTGRIVNPAEFSSSGMSKEVENLILENTELLSTKNALNVVKDDLIARVDELISEQEIMREEMKANNVLKDKLKSQVSELETELKKCKETLEMERKKISPDEDQKDDLSMAQRKRFTRVEMARVLMERNQYKERLMELQEAVRWTEMIRASREHPDLLPGFQNAKKKSTIWNYFEKLLNKQPKKISTMPTVRYNAPTGQSKSNNPSPQHREKPRMNEKKADFLQDELLTEKKRKELEQDRKEQYKQVRAHVKKEDGRMQAYGWSVPAKSSMAASKEHQPTSKVSKSPMPVPVPVYCKPLSEDDTSIKVWCAAGVCDLLAGETPSNILDQVNTGTTDVYQSRIWICTTNENKSFVTVVDANNPSSPLDKFIVSMEHVLCITFVPGSKNADPVPQVNIKCSPSNQTENNNGDGVEDSGVSLVKCTSYTELPDSSASEGSSADIPPETSNVTLHQSTMWLGMQNGCVFVHSVVNNWKERVFATRLPDSVLSISHIGSRVFIALANGSLAVFCRSPADRAWDMSQYYLMQLGKPQHSIRCQCIVDDRYVWCGYRNKVLIVNPEVLALEKTFDAHPRIESQIRQMVWAGDGVWVSIRLDSTLRLYHAVTHQHLQDVDIEPYVSKMLGTGKLGFSFIRITSLLAACNRLWIGTGNGVIICVPLFEGNRQTMMTSSITGRQLPGGGVYRIYNDVTSDTGEPAINTTCVPYCSMAQAQLSFHGHKDAVKFFVAVPAPPSDARQSCDIDDDKKLGDANTSPTMLVMSGGEGYVDFRLGVGNSSAEEDEDRESKARKDAEAGQGRAYLSHLIVWQVYQNSSSSSS